MTFTYPWVEADATARLRTNVGRFENLFAAREIMNGSILTRGYLAGFGVTIGKRVGSHWRREAARALGAEQRASRDVAGG